jgi:hypothetical protein
MKYISRLNFFGVIALALVLQSSLAFAGLDQAEMDAMKAFFQFTPVSISTEEKATTTNTADQTKKELTDDFDKEVFIACTLSEIDQILGEGTSLVLEDLPITLKKLKTILLAADEEMFSELEVSGTRVIEKLDALYVKRDRAFLIHQTTLAIEKLVRAREDFDEARKAELKDYLSLVRHLVLIQHEAELNSGASNVELEFILKEVESICEVASYFIPQKRESVD